jgi:hypothetical protein
MTQFRQRDSCLFCDETRLSRSHIIQRCLGGRLQPKLTCKACNEFFGATVEESITRSMSLRLLHEHIRDELPVDRDWVKSWRARAEFHFSRDGEAWYCCYSPSGQRCEYRRSVAERGVKGIQPALEGPPFLHDSASAAIGLLLADYKLPELARREDWREVRAAIRALSPHAGYETEFFHSRSHGPQPVHTMQLCETDDGVHAWINLFGQSVYRTHFHLPTTGQIRGWWYWLNLTDNSHGWLDIPTAHVSGQPVFPSVPK